MCPLSVRRASCVAIEELPSEVELLLACYQGEQEATTRPKLDRLLKGELDWDVVLDGAVSHGVAPLLAWRLQRFSQLVPVAINAEFNEIQSASLHRNVKLARSLLRILACLEERGILAAAFKGPFMAERLYGHLAFRQCADIDIFIRQQDVAAAVQVLQALGFMPQYAIPPTKAPKFIAADFELGLVSDGVLAELHWNCMPRFYGINWGLDDMRHRLLSVNFLGAQLLELAPEDLFLTLALHANKHFWERMIWAVDLAQLLRANPDFKWEGLFAEARRLRVEKLVLISIMLIQKLFGLQLPAFVEAKWQKRPELQHLCADACRNLIIDKPEENAASGYCYFLRARDSWGDRVRQVSRHVLTVGPGEWSAIPKVLPKSFYLPFHIARLGTKMGRSILASNGAKRM